MIVRWVVDVVSSLLIILCLVSMGVAALFWLVELLRGAGGDVDYLVSFGSLMWILGVPCVAIDSAVRKLVKFAGAFFA